MAEGPEEAEVVETGETKTKGTEERVRGGVKRGGETDGRVRAQGAEAAPFSLEKS